MGVSLLIDDAGWKGAVYLCDVVNIYAYFKQSFAMVAQVA